MNTNAITGKSRRLRQRLEMLHNLMFLVIIISGILLFVDVERFFGLFGVVFFLGALLSIEKGLTGNPASKGRNIQAAYLLVMLTIGLVSLALGVVSLLLTFKI